MKYCADLKIKSLGIFSILLCVLPLIGFTQKLDLKVQKGHTNQINRISFHPNQPIFATGGIDQSIHIWNSESGKLLKSLNFEDAVYALSFSADGSYLYAGGYGIDTEKIKWWDTKTWTQGQSSMNGGILDIEFSSNGEFMAIASSKGSVKLYNINTQEQIGEFKLQGEEPSANDVAFSLDNKYMIVANKGNFKPPYGITIWNIETKEELHHVTFEKAVESVQFTHNPNEVLVELFNWSGINSGYFYNWKTATIRDSIACRAPTFNYDASRFAYNLDSTLHVIETKTGTSSSYTIQEYAINDLTFNPDGSQIVCAGHSIMGYKIGSDKPQFEIQKANWINALDFSPIGDRLAFSSSRNGEVSNWNLKTGEFEKYKAQNGKITQLQFSNDGSMLSSASNTSQFNEIDPPEHYIVLFNTDDGTTKQVFDFEKDEVVYHLFSPRDDALYTVVGDTLCTIDIAQHQYVSKTEFSEDTKKIQLSKNEQYAAYVVNRGLMVYDLNNKVDVVLKSPNTGSFTTVDFDSKSTKAVVGGYHDTLFIYHLQDPSLNSYLTFDGVYPLELAHSPISETLAIGFSNGDVGFYDLKTNSRLSTVPAHSNLINQLAYRDDGQVLVSSSWDGKLILWNALDLTPMAELYGFEDGSWAVVDSEGRFDASNGGDIDQLHFVVNDNEVIQLEQLKDRYYEPGLLQKLLGYNTESLRSVNKLNEVTLYPNVDYQLTKKELTCTIQPRNGGVGKISLFINDKEVYEDLRPKLKENQIKLDLSDYNKYYIPNEENEIQLVCYNEDGYLKSTQEGIAYTYVKTGGFDILSTKPQLYAIVVGTSNYSGDELDLQFADNDATSFASSLGQVASVLFGEENVHINLLTTDAIDDASFSNKENTLNALDKIAQEATADDLLIVYLSGHGVSYGGDEAQFYYLTHAIKNGNIDDKVIRDQFTISSAELTNGINQVAAQKQVLVIDACSSGKLIEDILTKNKAVSSSQIRALERLKDRTGTFIITGSAADKVSYEASQYGQSLLTYSLLSGIQGRALRNNEYVDVMTLFQFVADHVQELASNIGGVQKPLLAVPKGGNSFDIGQMDASVQIELQQIKPVYIQSNFQEEDSFDDLIDLSETVDQYLLDYAVRSKSSSLVFVDVKNYPKAFSIKGRYSISDGQTTLVARLYRDKEKIEELTIEFTDETKQAEIKRMVSNMNRTAKSLL